MRFKQKVVTVTGSAMGIGEESALAFAREGAMVALVDIDKEKADSVAESIIALGGSAYVCLADVSDESQVRKMVTEVVSKWGRMDILVNNAGIYFQANVIDTPLEVWNRIIGVNLTGAFLCTKYAAEEMRKKGSGVIVNVASEAGLIGIKGQVVYNVSKGGMIQLTRSCAVDLAQFGVRVNCVCPGTTETPLVREAVNSARDPVAARRVLEEVRPLNRLGRPDEIASAILYMASDEAGYATGAILSIDGGSTAQ
jgi:NAD(P)-dependent dehydrogenase (short-subunit alcohol dehydrogenase family)